MYWVTLVPYIIDATRAEEQAAQHSVVTTAHSIRPDIDRCRSPTPSGEIRDKIALFADVDPAQFSARLPDVYLVPDHMQAEDLDALRLRTLGLERRRPTWRMDRAHRGHRRAATKRCRSRSSAST